MPAQEEYLRNIKLMHVVFCISCVALVAASLWAVFADYNDEWRELQRKNFLFAAQQLQDDERALETKDYETNLSQVEAKLKAAQAQVDSRRGEVNALDRKIQEAQGRFDLQNQQTKFAKAEVGKARADLGLLVRDGLDNTPEYEAAQRTYDESQNKVAKMDLELETRRTILENLKAERATLTKDRDAAEAELTKLLADKVRLEKARNQVDPQDWLARAKWDVMEWPIIEGFNGHLKPNQLWLPALKINYGGMSDVARFDRCITCHLNIDKVKPGNKPAFPFDPHGLSVKNADEMLRKDVEDENAARKAGKPYHPTRTYAHPFATHPRPDLFLTAASPHPMQTFGCTGCHEGQGSGTSFHNVQHMPNDPALGEEWHEKYGWFYNHFWEFPMLPDRLAEAGCIKCHHNVTELGHNPKFGASAPKAFEGFTLLTKYGCFGCHEVNGYNAGKRIGPDVRLEPQTKEEADRIAADPSAVAGDYRKVGPGLRHLSLKASRSFVEYWVADPQKFHPKTRMPKFFGLTNQHDSVAKELQPVEIAGIARYLDTYSEPMKLDDWGDYVPNAVRGKQLFSQRGCLACHEHADFPGAKGDFGPELTHAYEKIRRDEKATKVLVAEGENSRTSEAQLSRWLYTWVRDPTRHSARTKMPNTYLEPEGEGERRVDPAADIMAYLLQKPERDFGHIDRDKAEFKLALDKITKLFLKKVLSARQVENVMTTGVYPVPKSEIKGDEAELVIDLPANLSQGEREQKIQDARLTYIGRRTISRYGCYGCHDIPGYEKARPIGTALQDWGRKDGSKLALEHIEEYLHHHGEPDGSSTAHRVEKAVDQARGGEERDERLEGELSASYFYGQLMSHGRAGFFWQKLRDPRSYDYKLERTKEYDERLRMPKFPFTEKQIESVANFVLGLVAEPPAPQYVYNPTGRAKARIEGEKLLSRYNCTACHMVDLPEIRHKVLSAEYAVDASTDDAWKALVEDMNAGKRIPYVRAPSAAILDRVSLKTVDEVIGELSKSAAAEPVRVEPEALVNLRAALIREAGKSAETGRKKFNALVQNLAFAELNPIEEHLAGLDMLMKLKAPGPDQLTPSDNPQPAVFHGIRSKDSTPDDPSYIFVNWETHQLGQKMILPQTPIEVAKENLESYSPGRGGDFAMWLAEELQKTKVRDNLSTALQSAPPVLYQEGMKVQTPWLYRFLQNPDRLRYTTVLRMPQFNMSEKEAQQLADYFSAVDGSEAPYQDVPEREPQYLAEMNEASKDLRDADSYLDESFKVIDTQLCNGCHAVAGKPFVVDPKDTKQVRGPDLGRVADRLRPDWLKLWMFKPAWITPYTSMPVPFKPAGVADGKAKHENPNLFKGDEILQTIGARDALMNYHRLMESQRKVPATAQKPAEAEPEAKPAEDAKKDAEKKE